MEYRVPTNETPSYFNREAGLGSLVGSIVFGPLGFIAGSAIGGYIGKQRMERELTEGRVVKDPSTMTPLLSRESAIDGWVGKFTGIVAGLGIAALVSASAPVAAAIVGIGAITGTIVGLFHGANTAKVRMTREYEQAAAQDAARAPSRAPEVEREAAPGKSFAASIAAERQQAATQSATR